jgi:hypothetical protein
MPKGLPKFQEANQKWVDSVSKHLEDRGFTLGSGATDKKMGAILAATDNQPQGIRTFHTPEATAAGFGEKGLRNTWSGKMLDDLEYGLRPNVIERYRPMEYEWYHGTQAPEFNEFKWGGVGRQTKDSKTKLAPHFADHPGVAEVFAEGKYTGTTEGGRIIPAQLKINNPKVYTTETDLSDAAARWAVENGLLNASHFKKGGTDTRGLVEHVANGTVPEWAYGFGGEVLQGAGKQRKRIAEGFRQALTDAGHDGIVYGNNVEGTASKAAIPFTPQQIRSRFAAFDPANKDSGFLLGSIAGAAPAGMGALAAQDYYRNP